MLPITVAMIHTSPSSPASTSPRCGWQKATLRPRCSGSCAKSRSSVSVAERLLDRFRSEFEAMRVRRLSATIFDLVSSAGASSDSSPISSALRLRRRLSSDVSIDACLSAVNTSICSSALLMALRQTGHLPLLVQYTVLDDIVNPFDALGRTLALCTHQALVARERRAACIFKTLELCAHRLPQLQLLRRARPSRCTPPARHGKVEEAPKSTQFPGITFVVHVHGAAESSAHLSVGGATDAARHVPRRRIANSGSPRGSACWALPCRAPQSSFWRAVAVQRGRCRKGYDVLLRYSFSLYVSNKPRRRCSSSRSTSSWIR